MQRPLPEHYANRFEKRWWYGHRTQEEIIAGLIRECLEEVRQRVKTCPHQPQGCETCWGLA